MKGGESTESVPTLLPLVSLGAGTTHAPFTYPKALTVPAACKTSATSTKSTASTVSTSALVSAVTGTGADVGSKSVFFKQHEHVLYHKRRELRRNVEPWGRGRYEGDRVWACEYKKRIICGRTLWDV